MGAAPTGMGNFTAPAGGVKPTVAATPIIGGQAVQQTPLKPITGINRTTDIKSSVEEKSLKIPDFLRSK